MGGAEKDVKESCDRSYLKVMDGHPRDMPRDF